MSDEQPPEIPAEPQPEAQFRLGRDLKREDFTIDRVRWIADQAAKRGGLPLMSEEARNASLKAIRSAVAPDTDVWVFGYGSLMWNPAITVADSRKTHVRGYHRTFCLTLPVGRGTIEKPGLMLGIDRGGSCTGVAHRIEAKDVESELSVLWYREMLSGSYEPRWINGDVEGLGQTRMLTFVINRAHPRYEHALSEADMVQRLATAEGIIGTNREYLYRTAAYLTSMGITDGPLHKLERRVRTFANELDTQGEVK
ncbi:MAG TPA: gamma-glutamylcyclotransferase [Rhizomicrobium sp.]|nr:gamma-glutamylcyclotransferase [Rhizomicrobium sp.]